MSNVQQCAPVAGETPFATRETAHLTATARAIIAVAAVGTSLACSEQRASPFAPAVPSQLAVLNQAVKIVTPATVAWQAQARALVAANVLSPLAAGRVYAALAVAQFDAINETDHVGYPDGILPSEGFGPGGRSRVELERGAVAGASSVVLARFFPAAASAIDEQVRNDATWSGERTHPQFDQGLDVGRQAGARMIARVAADHFTDPWTGSVPVGSGLWRNNGPPAGPRLGEMTPYLLTSGSQFRAPPPPAFGSAEFLTALNEIKTLSANRTAEQTASAILWNYGNGTPTPLGYWNSVAGGLIESYRFDERGTAHVFALMHAAMMDALIACWDSKYFYWFIRPSQADPSITLPIGLPNHPSYPSGHSCVSSAATDILARFFPAEAAQLSAKLTQAGLSRMYAGIHYRFDISAGETIGHSVAAWAVSVDRGAGLLSTIY